MSNSYNIVARVSKIPTGTLELNHTAYTGTDPTAHTGTGFYYISAVLYDQTGAVKHSYAETQGKILLMILLLLTHLKLHSEQLLTVITQSMPFIRYRRRLF